MQRFLTSRSGATQSTKTNGKTMASKKPEKLKSPILTEEYKTMIREASYLGKRGYTIPKASLTEEDMAFLKQDLFLKPEVPGAVNYGGANQDTSAFPVYRESDKKLYIPRFYGVERYGHPTRSEIEPGVDINVPFAKPLRDYQEQIVQTYLDAVCHDKPSGGILQIFTGAGKCLGRDTPILMYDGSIKLVQDVVVGDQLMGDDSTPRTVLTLARGREMMYRISSIDSIDNSSYIVNESHILSLKRLTNKGEIWDVSVLEYLDFLNKYKETQNEWMGYRLESDLHTRPLIYPISITQIGVDDYYGFEIDRNRRFVLGDFTVTHNTVMALKIVSCLNKKTLILVHKEFLMNQWIERIAEYLPTARVGRIQGQVLDIEDKDIVIGMIQTLYNRTYPQEVYSQFGLLICDEVHHIASEQFSKTLLKCICPYTLGISATVQRKDKLTKLLHMFLGPLIYSMDRKKDDIVSVYGVEYRTGDADFNEVELDYMGKPKYSTMISKICDYIPRQQFILRIIQDLVIKNPGAQMIILGHNRSLLTALYEGVKCRGFASCGYYLGGMKQKDLKESEDKTVIVSTYAMAAEALDIPTLSILVMVTSKTDIVQSVGRILRKKHDNPQIIDIIDSHSIFQNQWSRRKTYYRKCNYRIRYINSHQYDGTFDCANWIKVYDPKAGTVIGSLSEKTEDSGNDAEGNDTEETEGKTNTIFGGKCMIDL